GIRLELPPAPITRRLMSPQTWKVRSVAHPTTGALLTSRQSTARWPKRIYTVRIARFSTYPEEVWSGIAAPQPSASSRKANDQFRAAMSWAQLAIEERPGKIGAVEHRFEEIRTLEMRTRQVRIATLCPPQIGAPKVSPRKIE